ncbi:3-hydroxyacyl-CoA dehydrogenase/enoyl-CoA hydratase family protein [Denitromonas ohlonensis]|uniref:3-hydroxyacyl-CoA dehydrogenase n=2 Tax=Denitromonas TaxID=139331 RepID=A0A557S9R4_9RHOO|nr:3-hydroxyacyl-CoA dehydrogenase NAD-binding domain-containing protein [Denitromonas ohlonensis]TVO63593.1 3-hydroxyacyl-CoA dehydrogenase [Denitromonas ohlonensis]TVO74127.1 3-hydroxyacyl-CoA dehydrogenase [Denitromonas ohlonensis]
MTTLHVRKAAVLGAGVMGAQIAAHLANAGVQVVLFDLASTEGDRNGIVNTALAGLKKLQPAPLASKARLMHIEAANYDDHLAQLADCDLVIEAIAERMDWKHALYDKITPHLSPAAILASNTSGLSIEALGAALPAALRPRFCGIHFFNPPRYMPLVEIIATAATEAATLDSLETWLTTRLGKGVIRARDTPNFVANRVGVFSLLAVAHHTAAFGLGFDAVDALTGPAIGRPRSATYRTLDVVGLDTFAHVVRTMQRTLGDDPWHRLFDAPAWLDALIERGALGQKAKAGIFRKAGKTVEVFDPATLNYRATNAAIADEVAAILAIEPAAERFTMLRQSPHPQARFLWAIFRDLFHYCAVQLAHIADNARDVDLALRWGFGWRQGPFETWQGAGWRDIAEAVAADIAAGEALSDTPLPAWVFDGRDGVHTPEGSWSPRKGGPVPRTTLPVYRRQRFPDGLLGECLPTPARDGETLFDNAAVRLWRLPERDSRIGILSFKSKQHAIGREVVEGLRSAIACAERELDGLVLWHEAPFAVGADLQELADACSAGRFEQIEAMVSDFQAASLALKYARVPTVAAVQGLALGGGCEFAMHATARVLALEVHIGLVEAGVGLIPAGGGCTALALRAAELARHSATPTEVMPFLQNVFMAVATAKVSGSALEAQELGFMSDHDTVLFHAGELLHVALGQARALAEGGHVPPLPPRGIPVAGRNGIAALEMSLVNMRDGAMISAHDYRVARAAAVALCGGEVDAGSRVDEAWLLGVERRLFIELLKTPETQARIRHMLDTGKPLRN